MASPPRSATSSSSTGSELERARVLRPRPEGASPRWRRRPPRRSTPERERLAHSVDERPRTPAELLLRPAGIEVRGHRDGDRDREPWNLAARDAPRGGQVLPGFAVAREIVGAADRDVTL